MWKINNLNVYSRIRELVKRIYALVKLLPAEEKFALEDQMRKAVVSVRLNMEEGSGKRTSKEFIGYLNNSMGSLREVRGCVSTGMDIGYFDEDVKKDVDEILRIERLLAGYIEYVRKKDVK